jgi:hypothetical protein
MPSTLKWAEFQTRVWMKNAFPVAEAAPGPADGPTERRTLPWWIRLLVWLGILVRR